MNEEEKFVIKTLKDSQNTYIENTKVKKVELSTDEAKVVLNLIEKQQKELEQIEKEHKEENGRLRNIIKKLEMEKEKNNKIKDKIIDLMAEELADWYMDNQISNKEIDKKYVIDKFTNKAEEDIKEWK